MDIKEEITEDLLFKHSKTNSVNIAKKCVINTLALAALIEIIFENKPILSQRAGWVLTFINKKDKKDKNILTAYLPQLIENLNNTSIHDAVKRNTFKLFEKRNAPENYEVKLLDLAIRYLQNKNEAIAIRVFAMTVMVNSSLMYPELKNEIKAIILDQYDAESPAYVSRAKKELLRLSKINF